LVAPHMSAFGGPHPELVTFYFLARYTGQRRSDLVNMKWTDIDNGRGEMSASPFFSYYLTTNWVTDWGTRRPVELGGSRSLFGGDMARGGIEKLKVTALNTKKPGRLSDGGNLYLEVSRGRNGNIRRSWIFRYRLP